TTGYSYDKVGNLTNVAYPNMLALQFVYDSANRVTSMTDTNGTTSYTYSTGGLLLSEDGPFADDLVSYTYTSNRLRKSLVLQQPLASAWTQTYAYDAARRLTNVTAPSGSFGYSYFAGLDSDIPSPSALVQQLTLPSTAYIANSFDGLGR